MRMKAFVAFKFWILEFDDVTWKRSIDDEATLSFMGLFYKHVTTNMSVCQALQYIMITLQGKEHLKRISNWAPFYVIGEDV